MQMHLPTMLTNPTATPSPIRPVDKGGLRPRRSVRSREDVSVAPSHANLLGEGLQQPEQSVIPDTHVSCRQLSDADVSFCPVMYGTARWA